MNDLVDEKDPHTWHRTAEELQQYFEEGADSQCLLWVNPAQFDPFEALPLVQEHRVRVPINHPRFDVRLGPYLVPLDLTKSEDLELFRDSVNIAWHAWTLESLSAFAGQPIAGWVVTQASAKELARHWAWHCHLHARRGLMKLLRFHDPSVREWLWTSLTEQQRQSLLGPAESLLSIGRGHSMLRHECLSHDAPADASQRIVLDERQWSQVEDYATVHAAWLAFSSTPGNRDTVPPGWERAVLEALSHASNYGINDMLDRELFALNCLQLGGAFHTAERMQPVWEKTRAGDYYGSSVEEVFGLPANQLHQHPQNA